MTEIAKTARLTLYDNGDLKDTDPSVANQIIKKDDVPEIPANFNKYITLVSKCSKIEDSKAILDGIFYEIADKLTIVNLPKCT